MNTFPERAPRVAVLLSGDARIPKLDGLIEGLKNLGYAEGKTLKLEVYNADNSKAELKRIAGELSKTLPDVIVAMGGRETKASKKVTRKNGIPVVFVGADRVVDRGLVKSMNSPGGNITGVDSNFTGLIPKRMKILKRLIPDAKSVCVYFLPVETSKKFKSGQERQDIAAKSGKRLGFDVILIPIKTIDELSLHVNALEKSDCDVIFLVPSAPILTALPATLAPAAVRAGIPIIGMDKNLIYPGVLAGYGPGLFEMGYQAARLVDKILKGDSPGNIPVEFPDVVDLVINEETVKLTGLLIPEEMLSLAVRVDSSADTGPQQ